MADNYLERKFEEMQMRKVSRKASAAIGKQKPFSKMTKKKIVFVTGGAKGIGKAIVSAFDSSHYRVAFCDIDEISGNELELFFIKLIYESKKSWNVACQRFLKNGVILIF